MTNVIADIPLAFLAQLEPACRILFCLDGVFIIHPTIPLRRLERVGEEFILQIVPMPRNSSITSEPARIPRIT
jgi:hypothetical protein